MVQVGTNTTTAAPAEFALLLQFRHDVGIGGIAVDVPFLRPARLLRRGRACAAKSLAALLFAGLPTCHGACLGTSAALERSARLNPAKLISSQVSPYIRPV